MSALALLAPRPLLNGLGGLFAAKASGDDNWSLRGPETPESAARLFARLRGRSMGRRSLFAARQSS